MFDFSLGEMLIVALVALIVLGPERLPKAARFTGLWVRKARAQWHAMKNELEQEISNEELKRTLQESQQVLKETQAELRSIGTDVERVPEQVKEAVAAPATTSTSVPENKAERDD
jgi:sec-independent protein translocase protein TatB